MTQFEFEYIGTAADLHAIFASKPTLIDHLRLGVGACFLVASGEEVFRNGLNRLALTSLVFASALLFPWSRKLLWISSWILPSENMHAVVDAHGIHCVTKTNRPNLEPTVISLNWDALVTDGFVEERRAGFLAQVPKDWKLKPPQHIWIPLRCIESTDQLNSLREFIKRRMDESSCGTTVKS